MNKHVYLLAVATGLLICSAGRDTLAAHREGSMSVSPGLGYLSFSTKHHLENAIFPNMTFAYDLNPQWSAALMLGMFHANQTDRGGDGSTNGSFYSVDGLYHFRAPYSAQPYLLAGLGVGKINDPAGNDPSVLGNANAGVGIEYFLGSSLSTYIDVRDLYTFTGGKQDILTNVGINFLFGGNNRASNEIEQSADQTIPSTLNQAPTTS